MVLVFNKKTWHYRLILWTFGENFFMDANIDFNALESMSIEKSINLSSTYPKTLQYIIIDAKYTNPR